MRMRIKLANWDALGYVTESVRTLRREFISLLILVPHRRCKIVARCVRHGTYHVEIMYVCTDSELRVHNMTVEGWRESSYI